MQRHILFFISTYLLKYTCFWCKCVYFFKLSWSCENLNMCMFFSDHYGVMSLKGCSNIESKRALLNHEI